MIVAYMLVNARQGKLKLVSNALKKIEEAKEVHELYGRFDILVRAELASYEDLKTFCQNKMQIVEGLKTCETLLVRDVEEELDEEA